MPASPRAAADLTGSRVLVTGGTGAIGGPVVQALCEAGADVRVLVRRAGPSLPAGVTATPGDLTDATSLDAAAAGVDAIVHLAALLHIVDPPPAMAAAYRRLNDEGTASVVEASRRAGVRRLVYASTIAVYGTASAERPADEDTPCAPRTLYASTKLAGERHVLGARDAAGTPLGVVLRLAAVYGAGIKGNYRRLLDALANGRYVQVGAGTNRRTLVHEVDVARAVVLALASPVAAGRVYNVTDGDVHTVADIVAAMADALGRRPPRWRVPAGAVRLALRGAERAAALVGRRPPVGVSALETLLEEVVVDGRRLCDELGFAPAYALRTGWRRVVDDLRAAGELASR